MPIYRRLPKRGFTNPFRVEAQAGQPAAAQEGERGQDVSPETLFSAGLIGKPRRSREAPGHR